MGLDASLFKSSIPFLTSFIASVAFCASSFPNNFLKKPPTLEITFPKNKKVCVIALTAPPSTVPIICAKPTKRGIMNCKAPPTTLAIVLKAPDIVAEKVCPCAPASPAALAKLPKRLIITAKTALKTAPNIDIPAPIPENITVNTLPSP